MADNNLYSPLVGAIYLFNLLLGTGVLTMPAVFEKAGYIYGIICITLLCLISYIQTTFLIEAMANANFVKRMEQVSDSSHSNELSSLLSFADYYENNFSSNDDYDDDDEYDGNQYVQKNKSNSDDDDSDNGELIHNNNLLNITESVQNLCPSTIMNNDINNGDNNQIKFRTNWNTIFDSNDCLSEQQKSKSINTKNIENCLRSIDHIDKRFQIVEKFELGNMTELFLNKYLSKLFFISIIVYLFGDLLIYNSMMSKSLRDISCTSKSYCHSNKTNDDLDYTCWDGSGISRRNAYRLFLLGFIAILGPLTYAKIQKTKIIQIMTIILRWMAFVSMIGITIKIFVTGKAKGSPRATNILNVPKLFGICVYSFMCHHSVPSMLTPVRNKSKIFRAITIDYLLVLGCYIIIALTAIFAFDNINQVYTLNFQVDKCATNQTNPASVTGFDIFLPTFPIFTLFSSYTILALTLINNMKVLINYNDDMHYGRIIQYTMPLIAIIPPLIIALFTEDISSIVQFVGSYSGTLIQYVFPTLLVFYSRKYVQEKLLLIYIKNRSKINAWNDELIKVIDLKKIYQTINPFASIFQHNFWIVLTAVWWIICICLVTLDHLREAFNLY